MSFKLSQIKSHPFRVAFYFLAAVNVQRTGLSFLFCYFALPLVILSAGEKSLLLLAVWFEAMSCPTSLCSI